MRRIDGYVPTFGYERPGDDRSKPDPHHSADVALMKRIAAVIEFHYLGQPFKVKVSHKHGIVQIQIRVLMGPSDWFVVPIWRLNSDPDLRLIVRACGDILERYKIPRCKFDRDHYVAAINAIPFGRRDYGYVPD